ncbi:MAG: methyltransferase domain-containing protein [Chloroflexi bacterium]|nr:methyltransferase domain-containing protein [Chloroflexota bacterium]
MALAAGNEQITAERDALVERLFDAVLGTMDVVTCYIGDRLGLYDALAMGGGMTAAELAARTGTHERSIREWLEQQAASGILSAADAAASADDRRFTLPEGHREVLTDRNSLNCLAGLIRLTVGAASPLSAVLDAYRTGAGVPYPDFGADTREGIAEMNRPMFDNLLGQDWLPSIPDLHARLHAAPAARILDAGCGTGNSTLALARAYPNAIIHGFDADRASIDTAQEKAAMAGISDRVSFLVRDASSPHIQGRYDLVTAFETIHDMGRPVAALSQMRELLAPGGVVLVADENVAEAFEAPAGPIDRLNYGFSAIHCLPATLAESDEAATGTVMRPETLRRYAMQAGFSEVEVAPIEHDFWRFYLLRP